MTESEKLDEFYKHLDQYARLVKLKLLIEEDHKLFNSILKGVAKDGSRYSVIIGDCK